MSVYRTKEEKNKTAIVISVIFHAVVLLLIIFLGSFKMADPPPGTEFVSLSLADYGDSVTGGGNTESEIPSEENDIEPASETTTQVEATPDPIVTQETSTISAPTSTEEPQEETQPEPEVSSALSDALNLINSDGGGSSSDGIDEGNANQGTQSGNIDGVGVVAGGAIGYEMAGRSLVGAPTLDDAVTEEGKVVLDVYVDKNGKVLTTKRNYTLSNTSSDYLFGLAQKAALTAKFNANPDAGPTAQKGKMTFNFRLH
jgi:hypothetical protein